MKWLIIFSVLVILFWYTSKDRSIKGMIESIVSDFQLKGPNALAIQEAFHGGHGCGYGGGGYGGGGGGYGYGRGRGGSWSCPWFWQPLYEPAEYTNTY